MGRVEKSVRRGVTKENYRNRTWEKSYKNKKIQKSWKLWEVSHVKITKAIVEAHVKRVGNLELELTTLEKEIKEKK